MSAPVNYAEAHDTVRLNKRFMIDQVLCYALECAKPNFTQLQLKLMELEAAPEDYAYLRDILERKFKLEPIPMRDILKEVD